MDIPAGAHIHAERLYQSEIEVFRQRDGAVDRFGYRVVDPRLVAGPIARQSVYTAKVVEQLTENKKLFPAIHPCPPPHMPARMRGP